MQKLHKSQSGIAHLTLIGLVLVFAIVGFTGWRVWQVRQDNKKSANQSDSASQSTSSSKPKEKIEDKNKLPEGFVEYTNQEYGFKFAYPKEWGEVGLKKDDTTGSRGYTLDMTFSEQEKIKAGILSKDFEWATDAGCNVKLGFWPSNGLDKIKANYPNGDSKYNNETYKTTIKVLKETNKSYVFERFEAGEVAIGGCLSLSLDGFKLFSNNTKFTGIEFFWKEPADSNGIPIEEFNKYKNTPGNFVSDTTRSNFVKVTESADSL